MQCTMAGRKSPCSVSKKSCTNKKEKCGLGCRSKVHASYGTKGKHGHMMEHVRRILTMIESGMIEKPGSPDMPEVDERPRTGGVTLGQRTKEGHEMTMKRQKFWADAMEKAQVNPELYSRVVLIPPQNQGLKNRKIEMRMKLFVEDDDGKITDESFVHCFEGTITAVSENDSGCSRSIFGKSSKWAVATIKWDVEFLAWGEVGHHALDPRLYGKEDVNGGWNILNDDYVAMQCLEDKFEELVQKFKQKSHGGDADMTAVAAMME